MYINRVLLVDDHELVLAGIQQTLEAKFTIESLLQFTNSFDALAAIESQSFDLYILDIGLGEVSGFELIDRILMKDSAAKIIVCTMHEEISYISHLLSSGAKGILLKRSSLDMFEEAVTAVMNNEEFLCPRFQKFKSILGVQPYIKRKQNNQLTPTERTVLGYIVEGYKTKEIAGLMFVTEDTIETHRKNLFIKLGVRNVAQLVSFAIREHLVD